MPEPNAWKLRARAKLKPGQKGTKKLCRLYGDRLVCVRYRYDAALGKRFTTVELIVEEAPWTYARRRPGPQANTLVAVWVSSLETSLREKIRAAGGRWDDRARAFLLRYKEVTALGLSARIVRIST